MTLYEILDAAIEGQTDHGELFPLLPKSRRGPMRTSIKHYAAILGIDPSTAAPSDYHRPDHEIRALIDAKASARLSESTRRNMKNDLTSLLRLAVEQTWLDALPAPMLSWRQRRAYPGSWVKRQENGTVTRYRLEPADCPPALLDELKAYIAWCEAPVSRNRDRRVAKRPITSRKTFVVMLRIAGFAVRELGADASTLTLRYLCNPELIEALINWWLTIRRGKVTGGLEQYLLIPKTIARHWFKDLELATTLSQLMRSLPPTQPTRDKQKRWLSLAQLEEIGLSLHPLNARRLHDYPLLKQPHTLRHSSQRTYAYYVAFSLIMRLLIRLPMRQRCIREMQLGNNLFQDHAGVWQIRFVGTQLKVAQVKGVVNRYEFPFPADLVPLLEEYLQMWRPKLATEGDAYVFLNSRGNHLTMGKHVSDMMARTTYRFTGVGVTPYMIRDIWATEYLEHRPGDVGGCARRLGNRPETVMAHYAHILQASADARAEDFLHATFINGKTLKRRA